MESGLTVVTLNGFLGNKTELYNALSPYLDISNWLNIAVSDPEQYQEISALGGGDYVLGLKHYILNRCRGERISIGYSLGGRLLLKLIELDSCMFTKLVFISTHPGLQSENERLARLKSDSEWAKKLETLSLYHFFAEWNAQPVLATSADRTHLSLENFDVAHTKKVLLEFSLATQADYRSQIENLKCPQLWVAGENDQKFVNLHRALYGPSLSIETILGAGHRVHLDRPLELSAIIARFLEKTD